MLNNMIEKIRRIEAIAYPIDFQFMQDCQTVGDLAEYCEGKPRVLCHNDWYVIVTKREIVDLASTRSLSLGEMGEILSFLQKNFGTRVFTLDARESTSYRLIRSRFFTILEDSEYTWNNEKFHEVTMKLS